MTFGRRNAVGPPWSHQFRTLEGSNSIPCQLASWRMLDLVGLSVPQLNSPTNSCQVGFEIEDFTCMKKKWTTEQPFFFSTQPRELNWFLSEIVTPAMSAEHSSTELSSTPCTRIKILDIPWSSVLCLRVSLRNCVVQVLVSNIANTALCWDCHMVASFVASCLSRFWTGGTCRICISKDEIHFAAVSCVWLFLHVVALFDCKAFWRKRKTMFKAMVPVAYAICLLERSAQSSNSSLAAVSTLSEGRRKCTIQVSANSLVFSAISHSDEEVATCGTVSILTKSIVQLLNLLHQSTWKFPR